VRVRDRDRGNSAQSLDPIDGFGIDETNAIPQNVAKAMLNQKSTLSDRELGFSPYAPNAWALRVKRVTMSRSQVV
jgi:hypothetical protein